MKEKLVVVDAMEEKQFGFFAIFMINSVEKGPRLLPKEKPVTTFTLLMKASYRAIE